MFTTLNSPKWPTMATGSWTTNKHHKIDKKKEPIIADSDMSLQAIVKTETDIKASAGCIFCGNFYDCFPRMINLYPCFQDDVSVKGMLIRN